MPGQPIKAIIFDLGNVLIDFDHAIAARRIHELTNKTQDQIYSLFFDSGLTALFEEGRIAPFKFFLEVKNMLGLKIDYETFLPIWNEIFFLSERNRQAYDLTKKLRNGYRLALLSNVNILHYEYIKKNFSIFDAFHHLLTSFEIGRRKPHPLIYQRALGTLKVKPENVFYTDDRPELVSAALALGLRGAVFTGVEALKKDLLDAGIQTY